MNTQVKPLDDLHTTAILWGTFGVIRKYPEDRKRVQQDYRKNYLTPEEKKIVVDHIMRLCPSMLSCPGKNILFGYHTMLYSTHVWRIFDWAARRSLNFFPFTPWCMTKMRRLSRYVALICSCSSSISYT